MPQPHLRIRQALSFLEAINTPSEQQNERSAITLLALLDLNPKKTWSKSSAPLRKITEMMDWMLAEYKIKYAPNSRETIRRYTVHQFVQMGILSENPDQPDRPINSPKWCYQVEPSFLALAKTYKTKSWNNALKTYLTDSKDSNRLKARHRNLPKIPVQLSENHSIELSAGGQNILIKKIVEDFCSRFVLKGEILLLGDAADKALVDETAKLKKIGVTIDARGKAPDVVIHDKKRNWLIIVEAVTSHGPIDQKRRNEIKDLFGKSTLGIVYVTAFPDSATYCKYCKSIAWETEVWIADQPDHMIHYNGTRFLGPYED
jgi:adenine-specific DNA-methyltransferase